MQAFVMPDIGESMNGNEPAEADAPNGAGDDLGGPPPDGAEPECAAVSEWRVAFARGLEEKMENERRVKAERAERAKQTLTTMNARWETAKRNAQDANRKQEKEFLRHRDGVISRMSKPGEQPAWNVIPELVDMTGKFKEGARDTSRMRQVLLRMKTN